MLQKSNHILLVHPGTQYSFQLAKQLNKRGLLNSFISGAVFSSKNIFVRALSKFIPVIYRKISNRVIDNVPSSKLTIFPIHEIKFQRKLQSKSFDEVVYFERNLNFQKLISDTAISNSTHIIGFDTSSWHLINRCNLIGKPFILDISIAHSKSKNEVYAELKEKYPLWSNLIQYKSNEHLAIEQNELLNADKLVVASSFSKKTLIENGIDEKKIIINPYGVDINLFKCKNEYKQHKRIKFLFMGLVDVRKGVPFLLDVCEGFLKTQITLTLVGPISNEINKLIVNDYDLTNIEILGKVSHHQMPMIIAEQDVFVFPSFFEGFALVLLEAMASGLPVITTTATAGADIIENGIEGFIIEPGDNEGLTTAIKFFVDNPNQIEVMGKAARKKAELYSWDNYGERWEKIINSVRY